MFKKNQRLSRNEFSYYFKVSRRQHSKYFTLLTSPLVGTTNIPYKTAIVVGKKVAQSAVQRNRLRRRFYADLKLILRSSSYKGVLIILVKPALGCLPRQTAGLILRKSIADMLKSA